MRDKKLVDFQIKLAELKIQRRAWGIMDDEWEEMMSRARYRARTEPIKFLIALQEELDQWIKREA